FERDLSSLEDLDGIESITQWIAEVAGHPDHPERLDDAARSRAVLALKLAGDAFPAHLVDETFRHGRVLFRTGDIGARRFLVLTEAVEARAAALPAAVRASVEGPMRLAHESSRLVVTTMLESFLLSFAAITLLVTITYRSLRLGLVSMVPNVLP